MVIDWTIISIIIIPNTLIQRHYQALLFPVIKTVYLTNAVSKEHAKPSAIQMHHAIPTKYAQTGFVALAVEVMQSANNTKPALETSVKVCHHDLTLIFIFI